MHAEAPLRQFDANTTPSRHGMATVSWLTWGSAPRPRVKASPVMPVRARFSFFVAVCTVSATSTGCNWVLGINEPEEVGSPKVTYYPWDGSNGDGVSIDATDAALEPPTVDASVDAPQVMPDGPPTPRVDSPAPVVDAKADGPRCLDGPDGGAECGFGCAFLCPLKNVCFQNVDCTSGRCFAGRCTLATCLDAILNGDETDIDCGGSCSGCATGRKCRVTADCTKGTCSNGVCQAPPQDASPDVPRPPDGSIGDASSAIDAADVTDAARQPDVVNVDVTGDADGAPDVGAADSVDVIDVQVVVDDVQLD